ncbi:hypothetical protein SUGI_0994470 [Cryptomeria japonica]|nr:hypothetical protein SUGI_0994470 [Cryptomeria japonica]
MMGYAKEEEATILELTYNYGDTEDTKGNAYAQVDMVLGLSLDEAEMLLKGLDCSHAATYDDFAFLTLDCFLIWDNDSHFVAIQSTL